MNSLVDFAKFPVQPDTGFFIPEDNETLFNEITRLAGQINTAEHRFLTLLAVLIEREAWSCGGAFKSPAHWLNYYCGIDLGAAREKVRVAKCLPELPAINGAFKTGTLSYSKVRAMTRVATLENEAYLLDIARHGTASHIEKLVGKYRHVQHLNAPECVQTQYQRRGLEWHHDGDGMVVIKARLTPEDGTLFLKAMDKVMDELFKDVSAETLFHYHAAMECNHSQVHLSAETALRLVYPVVNIVTFRARLFGQCKARSAVNGDTLYKERNAAMAAQARPLRAGRKGPSAALCLLARVTPFPASHALRLTPFRPAECHNIYDGVHYLRCLPGDRHGRWGRQYPEYWAQEPHSTAGNAQSPEHPRPALQVPRLL